MKDLTCGLDQLGRKKTGQLGERGAVCPFLGRYLVFSKVIPFVICEHTIDIRLYELVVPFPRLQPTNNWHWLQQNST